MNKYKDFDEFDEFDREDESVDLKPYLNICMKNWKKILVWAVCGALFGIMIGFSTPKQYTCKAVVAPELATRGTTSGGLSSLASLAGINMNTLALTDAMHPDLYPEVIKSTSFAISLFDTPVDVTVKNSVVHTDLYDYMVNYYKRPWWGAVTAFPHVAYDWVKTLFQGKDEFDDAEGYASMDTLRLTKQQETVVKALSKNITAAVEKKTYVLSLKVVMQDKLVAAQVANAVISKLQAFVVDYRTEKARENVEYYERIYDETRNEYLEAQRAYARYSDTHNGLVSQSARVQLKHLENEAQLRYQIYNQTAQNLLAARAKVQQEAPVLVIVQPGFAPHYGKPSKVKLGILWFLLAGALGAWITVRKEKPEEDKNFKEAE